MSTLELSTGKLATKAYAIPDFVQDSMSSYFLSHFVIKVDFLNNLL